MNPRGRGNIPGNRDDLNEKLSNRKAKCVLRTAQSRPREYLWRNYPGGETEKKGYVGVFSRRVDSRLDVWDPCPAICQSALSLALPFRSQKWEDDCVEKASCYTPYIPALRGQRLVDLCEVRVSLVYRGSSRPARVRQCLERKIEK